VDWLLDPFRLDFQKDALLAGSLVAITTAVIGTWVILRGMSFLSDALAHGVLPGIALAFVWGLDTTIGAAASAAVMVLGVNSVNRRTRLGQDTSIGLLFVGMLAIGVVIISRSDSYFGDLSAFLFGDLLGVDAGDLWLAGVAAVVIVAACTLLYRPFVVLSFDEQKAELLGMHPGRANLAMLALIALAVVASYRAVGTLLVSGLLIAPPATASLAVRRVPAVMALAAVLGVASVTAGLIISYHLDTAAGATAAAVSVALFFVVAAVRAVVQALRMVADRDAIPA
jgi:zinc/manganese transport system permease protein